MTYASALFVSLTFFALVKRLGLATRPFEVVVTSQQAYRALTDATLNDDMKEAIMRQSAKTLGRQFVVTCFQGCQLRVLARQQEFRVHCRLDHLERAAASRQKQRAWQETERNRV